MAARSRPYAVALSIGLVLGLVQFMALPTFGNVLKGPPVTVEVASLDELKQALERATPGSVIRLAAGVYQIYAEDYYTLVKGVQGLPDQPIVIQGTPGRDDASRPTIIDGGRSLDGSLQPHEHYRKPGSRPIELHDLLIEKQFRTERAINCFVFEDVAYLIIENLTVRNCFPAAFVIYGNSRYVTIRSSTLVGAMAPVFAGRYSDHLLIENNVWTQDPSGYADDQSGYSGRVDLTPRPGRMWDTIPWGSCIMVPAPISMAGSSVVYERSAASSFAITSSATLITACDFGPIVARLTKYAAPTSKSMTMIFSISGTIP
jgi:hypothetical protein